MKCISYIALILIIIGALNWGLWGFFQFDLVAWIFGGNTMWASRVVYSLIGLAGLWSLKALACCCCCSCGGKCECKGCSPKRGGRGSR